MPSHRNLFIYEKLLQPGAPPRTLLGKLTAFPRPPAGFWGAARRRKGWKGERREMELGKWAKIVP